MLQLENNINLDWLQNHIKRLLENDNVNNWKIIIDDHWLDPQSDFRNVLLGQTHLFELYNIPVKPIIIQRMPNCSFGLRAHFFAPLVNF